MTRLFTRPLWAFPALRGQTAQQQWSELMVHFLAMVWWRGYSSSSISSRLLVTKCLDRASIKKCVKHCHCLLALLLVRHTTLWIICNEKWLRMDDCRDLQRSRGVVGCGHEKKKNSLCVLWESRCERHWTAHWQSRPPLLKDKSGFHQEDSHANESAWVCIKGQLYTQGIPGNIDTSSKKNPN